ncbi:enoyl-CoA hydratase [uncultured Albimonas sp.]|uniref:enoyl-CoA hydratase n=1 Tax=uncultured Albimonas sp. TaxID=1331701 RepID=UPI0030EC6658|tara:strand:- start:142 stop:981 length:840 start_codon:yes stop_codon:yes gene_type:complete
MTHPMPEPMPAPIPEADGYTPRIVAKVEDGVGWMIVSNPRRRNALTLNMWRQIPGAMAMLGADPSVRVVAIRGEGDASFVSGADITEFGRLRSTPEQVAAYDHAGRAAGEAIAGCPLPTVAVIRTWCVGGGLGTALGCDLRIADAEARFAIPAARLGLGYRYPGVKTLVDLVGPSHAAEIFYTARHYVAEEALRIGLINRVLPVEGFEAAAADYLASIAGNAPLTMQAAKMAIRGATAAGEPANIEAIDAAIQACFDSEDYAEGRAAFKEKRAPRFRGR